MQQDPVEVVRSALDAFMRNDVARLEDLVAPDLEWTFLDPANPDPSPETCSGREQLEAAASRWATMALSTELEIVGAIGDKVAVVLHAPGLDRFRARDGDDQNFHLVTVIDGRIVAMRAYRDRNELLTSLT